MEATLVILGGMILILASLIIVAIIQNYKLNQSFSTFNQTLDGLVKKLDEVKE